MSKPATERRRLSSLIHATIFFLRERKKVARRELAQLPVGENLRMLARMLERDRKIAATRPPKPAN
jgi:hypothetical protein